MESGLPFLIESRRKDDILAYLRDHRAEIEQRLDTVGAVLLRGFDISTEAQFASLSDAFSERPLEYMYQSTPRTKLGRGIYTATEYSAGLTIPLHNENAFQRSWPLRLLFFCMYPADGGGGQTPLASTAAVTSRIDLAIRDRFLDKQVMYIRNYRKDIDLPWTTVFQTESRAEVEAYCRNHEIAYEWVSPDQLRTRQVCQAFARHPRTGALVWFNQAHLFHPAGLDPRTRSFLRARFRDQDLPRNATYGDGTPILDSECEHIHEAFRSELVVFEWRAGDVLILDNMLVSHGRNPYKGSRRVLTAMCDAQPSGASP